ncbi:MAG: TetR/AcrR family transcriptional regulator [Sandaracinaceae bacterium]
MPLPRFNKLDPDRRSDILTAAGTEFAERGFKGASYNRIIERSGISKGAMYYYFADKDDLYQTVLSEAFTAWFSQVGFDVQADDARTFWLACEELYQRSLRFVLADPISAQLCISVAHSRGRHEPHPIVVELDAQVHAAIEVLMVRGRELGAVRADLPSDLLVHATLALLDVGDLWLADHLNELGDDDVESTAAMLVGLHRRLLEPGA